MSDEIVIQLACVVGLTIAVPAIVWAVAWCVVQLFREANR